MKIPTMNEIDNFNPLEYEMENEIILIPSNLSQKCQVMIAIH